MAGRIASLEAQKQKAVANEEFVEAAAIKGQLATLRAEQKQAGWDPLARPKAAASPTSATLIEETKRKAVVLALAGTLMGRVAIWNRSTRRKIRNNNAPMLKNLEEYHLRWTVDSDRDSGDRIGVGN